MSETAPTPWQADDEVTPEGIWIYAWQGPLKVSPAIATGKADAALIVTAVNAMDELKSTLKRAEKELLWASEQFEGGEVLRLAADECRAALRLAEGERE